MNYTYNGIQPPRSTESSWYRVEEAPGGRVVAFCPTEDDARRITWALMVEEQTTQRLESVLDNVGMAVDLLTNPLFPNDHERALELLNQVLQEA